jgi:FkbM family methyltransferase
MAKFTLKFGYFKGSYIVHRGVVNFCPLRIHRFDHPNGFSWMISSRETLSTYLSNCESYTTKLVRSRAPALDTFMCVGANRGWYPLNVGQMNSNARIISFECNSAIYKELSQNIFENRNQSELYSFAIGDDNKEANLYMPKFGNEGMSTLYPLGKNNQTASIIERVRVTTLDACFDKELTSLGELLILMDIEGGEMLALKGASRLIRDCSPTLILEINPEMLAKAGSSSHEVFRYLQGFGYESYWIDERERLTKVGSDNQLPHLLVLPPHSGANYLFVKIGADWIKEFVGN